MINLRKILMVVLSVILIFVMSGCNYDLYYGKRPFDYGAATWVCESPSAWFVVNPEDDEYYSPKGEIICDNQTCRVKFRFVHGTNEVLIYIERDKLSGVSRYEICGKCKFSPEKFVIKIDKDRDDFFNGQYDEWVFIRTPAEE